MSLRNIDMWVRSRGFVTNICVTRLRRANSTNKFGRSVTLDHTRFELHETGEIHVFRHGLFVLAHWRVAAVGYRYALGPQEVGDRRARRMSMVDEGSAVM